MISIGLVLFLFPMRVFGDMSFYFPRAVEYCFKISNINDYSDYIFLQYAKKPQCNGCLWSGGHQIINSNECITSKSGEDDSTVYAIKKKYFNESDISDEINEEEKYFKNNDKLVYSGIIIKPVFLISLYVDDFKKSQTTKIADVLEITSLNDNNFKLNKKERLYIQSDGIEKTYDYFIYNEEESIFYENESLPENEKNLVSPRMLLNFWYVIPFLAVMAMIITILLRRSKK